jgi:hypothetical protein
VNLYSYLGIVERQRLKLLLAEDGSSGACQLTSAADEASFQQQHIDISASDGLVLLVRGIRRDDWIHSAVVVERGSELLSVIAQAALGQTPRFPQG